MSLRFWKKFERLCDGRAGDGEQGECLGGSNYGPGEPWYGGAGSSFSREWTGQAPGDL